MAINRDREMGRPLTIAFDASERERTDALLRDLGLDEIVIESVALRVEDDEVQSVVSRLRAFAEANPHIVLGALSALVAGGAVIAGRAVAKKKKAQSRSKAASKAGSSKSSNARKSAKARKSTKARTSSKRTLIEPHPGDKRYVRRDAKGRIKESVDVGRSLAADRRQKSKTRAKSGAGDKGDR